MNKSDLITQVAESTELSKKDATKAVDAVFDAISKRCKVEIKYSWSALATSRFASVPHGKAATRKQVKKSKSLRAKFLHLNLVKRSKTESNKDFYILPKSRGREFVHGLFFSLR